VGAGFLTVKGSRILHSHRQALTLLERARVRLDDTNVVYDTVDDTMCRTFNLPWRNLSVLLLGQGTSITNSAMRRLSGDDVLVGFTGSGGTPLVMASHNEGCHGNSRYLRPWVDVWTDPAKSLAAARSFQETRLASLEAVAEKVEPGFDFHEIEDLCGRYRKKVNYPGLKAGASSFTGGCLSSNVLSRSYAASTGCTPGPRGQLVRRQTPLPKQLRRIVANVAPYIPSLKG
jgi:hypothetical protein